MLNTRESEYSLTPPYGHLYNMDASLLRTDHFWSQKCQKLYIPYLYNMDTSVNRTLGSVPLVSVLKRFNCISINFVLLTSLDYCINTKAHLL